MNCEPSDIVKLLRDLASEHDDATCESLHDQACRGEPILNICHQAILTLVQEKMQLENKYSHIISSQNNINAYIPNFTSQALEFGAILRRLATRISKK